MNYETEIEVADLITEIVCNYYNAPEDIFTRKTRKREYIKIRHLICYLVKRHTSLYNQQVARKFNLKNHSSIILLIRKIEGEMMFDKTMKAEVKEIEAMIKMKGLSKEGRIKEEEFYHVNMDNFISFREDKERAIIFVGYSEEEIIKLIGEKQLRHHEGTRKFILEKNEKGKTQN